MLTLTVVAAAAAAAMWVLSPAVVSESRPDGCALRSGQCPSTARDGDGESAPGRIATARPGTRLVPLHSTPRSPFVRPSGLPVQLHGVNMIPVWRNQPTRTWTQWHYLQIARKGFNAVRFVLYWDVFEPRPGEYDQTSLRTLDTAIARAKAAGLYVILDEIHLWGPGGMNYVPRWARAGDSVDTVRANGSAYLRLLGHRYRNNAAVAAFDLVSEFYRQPIDQNAVLRTYDSLITQVRRVDPRKIILIEPTYGDSSVAGSLANFGDLTNRANVVWSIHDFFAGGDDDGYNANGGQIGDYTWNGTTGYTHPNRNALASHLLVQLRVVQRVGLPMWIGEFGIGADTVNHDKWIADQLALFRRYGLGWAWWGYGTSDRFNLTGRGYSWKPWARMLVLGARGGT
jgi:Cellulase (glycosyl hydrolase family 5)